MFEYEGRLSVVGNAVLPVPIATVTVTLGTSQIVICSRLRGYQDKFLLIPHSDFRVMSEASSFSVRWSPMM